MATPILAEIRGRIRDHNTKQKNCILLTASGSIYTLDYGNFFMPIEPGDFIYAKCNFKNNNQTLKILILVSPALVQLGTDEHCIKHCLKTAGGKYFSDTRVSQLYDKFQEEAGSKDKVSEYIDKMAESYNNTKSNALILTLSPLCNALQAQSILQYWYKKRVLRQLYLFGLTNTDINNLKEKFTTQEIYKQCTKNPYLLTDIKIKK